MAKMITANLQIYQVLNSNKQWKTYNGPAKQGPKSTDSDYLQRVAPIL